MPSDDLLPTSRPPLDVSTGRLTVPTTRRRANAWLAKMDRDRAALVPVFEQTYGADRCRPLVDPLACVLHGVRGAVRLPGGREWMVRTTCSRGVHSFRPMVWNDCSGICRVKTIQEPQQSTREVSW